MSHKRTLSVLTLRMSLIEQRIVTAALTMSHERWRSLNYAVFAPGSKQTPEIVIASANCDRKQVARQMVERFGPNALAEINLIMVDGSYLLDTAEADRARMLTPYGLLECLDRAAAETASNAFGDSTIQMAVTDVNAYRAKRARDSAAITVRSPKASQHSTLTLGIPLSA